MNLPTGQLALVEALLPGEGGYIQTCDDAKPVCKMSFGNGRTGWVARGSAQVGAQHPHGLLLLTDVVPDLRGGALIVGIRGHRQDFAL